MKGYGQRIKELRIIYDMNQNELAKKLGISQPALSDLENSIYPPLNRIEQICQVLGITLNTFFCVPDDSQEHASITDNEHKILNLIKQKLTKDEQLLFWETVANILTLKIGK